MATDELVTARTLEVETEIPEKTWANWRYQGVGPNYLKLGGHVRYRRVDIEKWLAECEHTAG